MAVFWDVTPCSLIDTDRSFRGTYCLHYQGFGQYLPGLHGATSQKTAIFVLAAMKTTYLTKRNIGQ
jgi:hypothetical protein